MILAALLAATAPLFGAQSGKKTAGTGTAAPQPVEKSRILREGRLRLQEAVELALRRNPQLDLNREKIVEARSAVAEQEAAFDPTVGATVGANSSRQASASSELDGAARPESDTANATATIEKPLRDGSTVGLEWDALDRSSSNSSYSSLNPSYDSALRITVRKPLLRGAGRENALPGEIAAANLLDTADQWRAEVETVVEEVERAYWAIAATRLALDIRKQGLGVARLILDETTARQSARVEVLEAKSNVVRREAEVATAAKNLKDARDRLFQNIGILGGEEPGELVLDDLLRAEGAVPDSADCYGEALRQGVDARLEENRLALARLRIEQARLEMRPTLDLSLTGGLLGRDGRYGGAVRSTMEGDGRYCEAGIELRIPWGLKAEKERLRQADSRLRQEEQSIDSARLDLFARVREFCRRIDLGLVQLKSAATAVELNQARFEEQRARRANGQAILRDLLEAQAALDEARLAELQARVEVLDARLGLDALRGAIPIRHHLKLELPDTVSPVRRP